MPKSSSAETKERAHPLPSTAKAHKEKRHRQAKPQSFDIGRFFMPNIEKMAKSLGHEFSGAREELRSGMSASLRNQEIVIAQNKKIIELLEGIHRTLCQAGQD